MAMRVRDIMLKDVPTLNAEMRLSEAVYKLVESGFSGLPVTDESGEVLGIVTEADALSFLEFMDVPHLDDFSELASETDRRNFLKRKVRARSGKLVTHIMNQTPVICTPDTTVDELAEIMIVKAVRLLPVVEGGKLAGIVTRRELLKLLLKPDKTAEE